MPASQPVKNIEAKADKEPEQSRYAPEQGPEKKKDSIFEQVFKKESARESVPAPEEKTLGQNAPQSRGSVLAEISNDQKSRLARQKEIEKIMEENLEKIYLTLSRENQAQFKSRGEVAAVKINDLLDKGKATLKKIILLLKQWFNCLPGVNKFFLEQEAKIKADKIIEMRNQ